MDRKLLRSTLQAHAEILEMVAAQEGEPIAVIVERLIRAVAERRRLPSSRPSHIAPEIYAEKRHKMDAEKTYEMDAEETHEIDAVDRADWEDGEDV